MRVGIVGLGYWGSKVFDEYAALRDEDEIDAVIACDADPSKLEGVARADGSFESLDAALDAVDALHICTDNRSHYPIAERAMEAGKDVLVEKPLTTDKTTAYDLVELASETGRILQTGHIFRFANVVRRLRELYADGYFGTVYDVSLRWTHWMSPVAETNVLWDLLPHPLDILNFVTGEWPASCRGVADAHRADVVESAHVQLRLDGTAVSIQVSWADRIRRRSVEIAGSDRSARVDCVAQSIEVYDDDGADAIAIDENNTIRAEAENFIQAVDTRQNTFNSAIVGARAVDTIQAIEEAIDP